MLDKAKFLLDRFIFADNIALDKKIFNLVAGFGFLASLAALALRILEKAPLVNIAVTAPLPFLLMASLVYGNTRNAYKANMIVTLVVCCDLLFPVIFFTSGGIGNGMTGYFVLIMVLTMLLARGILCGLLLLLSVIVISASYALDYFLPGLSTPASSTLMQHVDNINGYLVSGLFIGVLVKFQARIHIKEKRKAEAASEAKSAFLASVSHAIRTPLNAIIGFSELGLRSGMPEETMHGLEKIHSSAITLLNIINDILDISRIESGKFQLKTADYDVASSINDTITLNMVRIGSKSIDFTIDIDENTPVTLHGDELRIKQVLNNILSNAFKYTNEGSVKLKIECERDNDLAWITVSVTDSGVGIRREDMTRLFSDFRQFHIPGEARQEGTGLGLSISKNLTELMGGAIMVESEYGRGSTFIVIFPQHITDPAPIGKELAERLSTRRFKSRSNDNINFEYTQMPYARVLVVDDVEINLVVAASLMEPYGLTVDCVGGGKEALRRVSEAEIKYDAIFMDHMMPEIDGMEVVRRIREEIGTEYAANVPIIALTANALVGNEEMFLRNGFQAFLSKPIDSSRLDEILKTFVQRPEEGGL